MSNFGIKNIWKDNASNVDTTNLVTTNTNQTITGDKQFNSNTQFNKVVEIHNGTDNDCSMAIHREANKANFVGFFKGNDRIGYIGRNSSGSDNFSVGSDLGDLQLLSHSNISCNSKKLINLAEPTANTDASTKNYVDTQKYGDTYAWVSNFSNLTSTDLSDAFHPKFQNSNMNEGNYRIEAGCSYEVLIKYNIESKDFCFGCIIAVNTANYDNVGVTTLMPTGATSSNTFQFMISLKNNQFTLWTRKSSGSFTTFNARFDIWVRKIGKGTFSH